MFDLSMVELGVIALVALLVLGPERLPKAARTLGFYVRKARQSWYSVRAEFERELAAEELKRSLKLDEVHATLEDTARSARDGLQLSADAKPAAVAPAQDRPAEPIASQPQASDAEDDGLTAEERARQCEPMAAEAEFDGSDHSAPNQTAAEGSSAEDPARTAGGNPADVSDERPVERQQAEPKP